MLITIMYGIPQIMSFKWCTMCGPGIYLLFYKICGFPHGSERVKSKKPLTYIILLMPKWPIKP